MIQVARARFRVYDNGVECENPIKLKAVQGGTHPQCAENIEEMDDEDPHYKIPMEGVAYHQTTRTAMYRIIREGFSR